MGTYYKTEEKGNPARPRRSKEGAKKERVDSNQLINGLKKQSWLGHSKNSNPPSGGIRPEKDYLKGKRKPYKEEGVFSIF